MDVAGKSTVLAAYTCTPLVTFPGGRLKDGTEDQGEDGGRAGRGGIRRWILWSTRRVGRIIYWSPIQKHGVVEKYQRRHRRCDADHGKKVKRERLVEGGKDRGSENVTQMDKLNERGAPSCW